MDNNKDDVQRSEDTSEKIPFAKRVCMILGTVIGALATGLVTSQWLHGYPLFLCTLWGALVGLFIGAGIWGAFFKDD